MTERDAGREQPLTIKLATCELRLDRYANPTPTRIPGTSTWVCTPDWYEQFKRTVEASSPTSPVETGGDDE